MEYNLRRFWPMSPAPVAGLHFSRALKTDNKIVFDLHDGQELLFGPLRFRVIHTPGHSPDSVCLFTAGNLLSPAETQVLFSGDLLFHNGVGRFDLKGGSFRELVTSLKHRLASLPDHTDVLPGHGPATTLGKERLHNPLFR
jgi:glyoxylase-like metal-dependent hydrolase (beta-lactamase superfamily II)